MAKRMLSHFIAVAMLMMILPLTAHAEAAWSFDAGIEGWAANKGTLAAGEGYITHTISAGQSNAFLLSPNGLNIDGSVYKYIKIRLKNNNVASRSCIVSFVTTTETSWDSRYSTGTKSVMTATGITGYDTDYKEYVIDMSGNAKWTNGTITRFRLLTFLNETSVTAGSMDIDLIEVLEEYEPPAVPTPTPQPQEPTPTPTAPPASADVTITAEGAEGAAVGTYACLTASAPDDTVMTEIYANEELVASASGSGCSCFYRFDTEGVHKFTAKAHRGDETVDISQVLETGYIKNGIKDRVYAARYTFDSGDEGFVPRSGYAELNCEGGIASVNVSAANAYIYKSGINLDLSAGDYVIIRMMNKTNSGRVILQWKTNEDNTLTESKKVTFIDYDSLGNEITKNDNEYREYVFYMGDRDGWKNKHLNFLQIYPSAQAESGSVDIDEIDISDMYKEPEPLPVITVYSDSDGATLFTGDEITISAENTGGGLSRIAYYNETDKLAESFEEPYQTDFALTDAGTVEIYAYAFTQGGAIVRSENAVTAEVTERYTISVPSIADIEGTKRVTVDIGINDRSVSGLTAVAAVYDENGKMLAIKSERTTEGGTINLDFAKSVAEQTKTVLVTVIGSWEKPLGYMQPFTAVVAE